MLPNYKFLAILTSIIQKNLSRIEESHLTGSKFCYAPKSASTVTGKQPMQQKEKRK